MAKGYEFEDSSTILKTGKRDPYGFPSRAKRKTPELMGRRVKRMKQAAICDLQDNKTGTIQHMIT